MNRRNNNIAHCVFRRNGEYAVAVADLESRYRSQGYAVAALYNHKGNRAPLPPPTEPVLSQEAVVSLYERGELTYDEAHQRIVDITPAAGPELYFWELELFFARELLQDGTQDRN